MGVTRAMDNELYHHGIKGQKWGVRRFQNKDGSLTFVGKKRYGSIGEAAKEHLKNAKQSSWEKSKRSSEKIKAHWESNPHKQSKREIKFEQQYLEKGMSPEEAKIAAYKRVKTEKILAMTAGVAVASVAAYVAYKQYDKRVDKLIPSGTMLQNVSVFSDKGVSDAFYFSMTKNDNDKYKAKLGDYLRTRFGEAYVTKIAVKDNMKVASETNATKALAEMLDSDPNNVEALKGRLNNFIKTHNFGYREARQVAEKGLDALENGKVNSKVYEAFNLSLSGSHGEKLSKDFYDLLKSKGYDAIMDINDKKYSGYDSAKPMIAFNAAKKAVVDSVNELEYEEKRAAFKRVQKRLEAELGAKTLASSLAGSGVTAGLVTGLIKKLDTRNRDNIVSEYRKQHPNTKLSYNEIIDQYYRSK